MLRIVFRTGYATPGAVCNPGVEARKRGVRTARDDISPTAIDNLIETWKDAEILS